ncbi:MAG TPA: PP2C family protein-serine/threonine phosphatase [Candidatus Xenobia bacterium]|nr:PP2C family protein-serine/threonine phosphatase [Candidatus Xenobia bacterium]
METPQPVGLACMEVWGGCGRVCQTLELPGLLAWIYSEPYAGSETGGDVYYLSACSKGQVARICIADIAGHGASASRLAEALRELMRKHVNAWDQSEFARELNRSFQAVASPGKFATAALYGFYSVSGELVSTNGGHLPPLWYRRTFKRWELLGDAVAPDSADIGLPLGLIDGTHYVQTAVRLLPGDLLILYTDAFSEARNPKGEMLGVNGLLELAKSLPVDSPAETGRALLDAVARYRGGAPAPDDQTLLVLQRIFHPAAA